MAAVGGLSLLGAVGLLVGQYDIAYVASGALAGLASGHVNGVRAASK